MLVGCPRALNVQEAFSTDDPCAKLGFSEISATEQSVSDMVLVRGPVQ